MCSIKLLIKRYLNPKLIIQLEFKTPQQQNVLT